MASLCRPPSFENRRVCPIGVHRRGKESLSPACGLQCRRDRRLKNSLTMQLSASSARFNGLVLPRGIVPHTVELDEKVIVSQLAQAEPLPTDSSTISNGSSAAASEGTYSSTSSIRAEDSQNFVPRGRPLVAGGEERPLSFERGIMEEPKLPVFNNVIMSSRDKPSEQTNGIGSPTFTQRKPVGQMIPMPQGQPLAGERYGSDRPDSHFISRNMNTVPSSQYYEPKIGDLVLGVVTHADNMELSVEIGGRVPAMMTMREFQPLTEVGTNSFFKLPLDNDRYETVEGFVVPPVGNALLVEDKAVNYGAHPGESVKIGTVFVAEVLSKALGEGRPLLSCRRLAEKLTFLRIEQILRTGEQIQIEITSHNDGGLQGCLEGIRAFLPKSELLVRPENTAALQDYVGKTLTVAVVKMEHHLLNVIVSEIKPWMSKNLLLGTVHDLIITKLMPYGLQVEIVNTSIRGFIHITNMTRGFVTSVYIFFTEDEVIKGMVIKGRKPGQLAFSIEALEPPEEEGLLLRNKQSVFEGAEEVAKSSPEYQLPMEERRLFATRTLGSTRVAFQDRIANLPWLQLQKSRTLS